MIEIIIFGSLMTIYIGTAVYSENKAKKRHKEMLDAKINQTLAAKKLTEVIQKLEVDPVQLNSLKRWLKATIDQAQQLEETLNKVNNPEPIVFKPDEPFDLDKFVEEIKKEGAIVIDDGPSIEITKPIVKEEEQ